LNSGNQPPAGGKAGFRRWAYIRRLFYVACLGIFTFQEYLNTGFLRRTFVFYTIKDETPVVEDRMLPRIPVQERELTRYVEEALLGPVTPETAPLFFRETLLRSLLYRDGTVYVDLSEAAALPPLEDVPPKEGEIFQRLRTLSEGIRRNFPAVLEVKLFINVRCVEFRDGKK
jgi:hypothetical protein